MSYSAGRMRFLDTTLLDSMDESRRAAANTSGRGVVPMRASVLGLFPSGVIGAELTDLSAGASLMAEEMAAVARASARRRAEFASGRQCARAALRLLGHDLVGIPSLPTNAPRWPDGVTGSVSHSLGYCGAVVTWSRLFGAIGFDVERRGSVSPDVLSIVASESEAAGLSGITGRSRDDLATVLFSAKEAYYKAHHQAYGSELDFPDVEFHLTGPDTFEITHRVLRDDDRDYTAPRIGRFRIGFTHVFTALTWHPERGDGARATP